VVRSGSDEGEGDASTRRLPSVREVVSDPRVASLLTLRAGEAGLDRAISHPRIQKNGLVLVGHMRGIVPSRVQILGETEISFLEGLAPDLRRERLDRFFELTLSLVVVTRGVEPTPELLEAAASTDTPLVVASERSSRTIGAIHAVLDRALAPEDTLHGVLVDIHGIGTLLIGAAGIGKSECALFLVERGHRLVADDRVHLSQRAQGDIVGRPEPLLRHHLEVRGIGILNVRDLFGATAVRDLCVIDLVIELCTWDEEEDYERLGLDDASEELLGRRVPRLRIPVRPGRDMAVILEVAARNELLKREGHHAARRFADHLAQALGEEGDNERPPEDLPPTDAAPGGRQGPARSAAPDGESDPGTV
jgi:HPr kinase/phosphorylase